MNRLLKVAEDFAGLFIFLGIALGYGGSLGHFLPFMIAGVVILLAGVVGITIEMSKKKGVK